MTILTFLAVAALAGAPSQRLYVPNQDDATVSIIDTKTRKLLETIDLRRLGFGDNPKPHHVQVESDGSAWYVTLIGAGKVVKFSRENKVLATASMEVPGLMALHPTKDLMFVARSMSAVNPPPRLAIIRRSDMKVLDEVELLFPRPHGVVIHPKGERLFVTSLGTNQIASVGVDAGDVKLVELPGPAHSIVQAAVSPDGRWLAVTGELTGKLFIFDVADPAQPKLVHELAVGAGSFEPVFTGGGRWIFVTARMANHVTVVDTKSWAVVDSVPGTGFVFPHGSSMSADGKYVFVSNEHQKEQAMDHSQHGGDTSAAKGSMQHMAGSATGPGALTVICAATRKVVATIPVGNNAAGIGTALPSKPLPAPSACR
jgi:YVTN family beta-propeller protein